MNWTSSAITSIVRAATEIVRNQRGGESSIRTPTSAKTAKKLKRLADSTAAACAPALRKNAAKPPSLIVTKAGKKMVDTMLTSIANTTANTNSAVKLARNICRIGIGSTARFQKSRRSGNNRFQRSVITSPVMVIERTMKKYSSEMEARKGSKCRCPRKNCSSVEYLSSKNSEANAPGAARNASTTPKPTLML